MNAEHEKFLNWMINKIQIAVKKEDFEEAEKVAESLLQLIKMDKLNKEEIK